MFHHIHRQQCCTAFIRLNNSTTQSTTPLSITYPSTEYQSLSSTTTFILHNHPSHNWNNHLQLTNITQSEYSQPDSGLIVPVFQKGDDPIDAINHIMSFLTAVGRQTTYAAGIMRKYTPGASRSNTGKQLTVICYNCKGYISKQCTMPKRKRDETWFNVKCLAGSSSSSGKFNRGRIAFLADPDFLDTQTSQTERNEQYAKIERLKQTLSEQVQEKDSLMKTVSDLKNDLKMEENRNIDREIALEKKIKQLDNIISKLLICADVQYDYYIQICYDHSTKQAIGFEKPFYLKKVRESKPKLYDRNVILKMDTIVIPDSDETLMLCEESRSKMLLKEQDPMVVKNKVNTKPINYAVLNNDYNKRFVRQSDLYSEHAYWKATSVPPLNPSPSSTTNKVEVPKEFPKVSMVNTSLKELKRHLAGFDQVVKERTTATAITEGTWGFEHTKACFRDEIIPFIKELKDIFNNFNQYLVDKLADVQNVFYQMEQRPNNTPGVQNFRS
ncbi:hypothetical protein Tco_0641854 [Tanacetum coccineum]